MSSSINSGDLDESSEADKVENECENSDCRQDSSAVLRKAVEDPSELESVEYKNRGLLHQDEVLTADQQSNQVEKQTFDQTAARDVGDSISSQLEHKSNDFELERDTPVHSERPEDQQLEVVAEQNFNQNVGDSDSRPKDCEEKSNDRELERDIPMESENSYSGETYVFPNF